MKKAAAVLALALASLWIAAQTTGPQANLAGFFPPGALIYVESRDFAGMLRDWNGSSEKALWLKSDNYQAFSRTRLFLRLQEAHQQYAAAAGFLADMPFVNSLAGGQSGVAIYDIGKLEFLYVTRLASAPPAFQNRTAYETRQSAGRTYYVRTDPGSKRTAAFAEVDGWVLLGTREDLVGAALARIAGGQGPALTGEAWFESAVKTAPRAGELRMVMHFPALLRSPHFRSYWIQRNVDEYRDYLSGVNDLFREPGQIREERALVRLQPAGTELRNEPNLAQVLAVAPPDAGLARAWASPSTEDALGFVWQKLVRPGPSTSVPSKMAPGAASIPVAGDESDLETRIDVTVPDLPDAAPSIAPFRALLERVKLDAMLTVQSSRKYQDGVFIGNHFALVLLAPDAWDSQAVSAALPGVAVRAGGRNLVLSDSNDLAGAIAANFGKPPAGEGASFAAIYRHSHELEPFARMMALMDHGERPVPQIDEGRPPEFFSENVASLGRVLGRVETASVFLREDATKRTQTVTYKLRP